MRVGPPARCSGTLPPTPRTAFPPSTPRLSPRKPAPGVGGTGPRPPAPCGSGEGKRAVKGRQWTVARTPPPTALLTHPSSSLPPLQNDEDDEDEDDEDEDDNDSEGSSSSSSSSGDSSDSDSN